MSIEDITQRLDRLEALNPLTPENFFTAKGDLLTFTGLVPTLLSIGNDDELLVVDSGEDSGFIYRSLEEMILGAFLTTDGSLLTVDTGVLVELPVGTINQYLGNDGTLLEWRDLPIIVESSGLKANVAVDTIGLKAVMLQKEFDATTQSAKGDYSGLLSGYRNSIGSDGDYSVITGGRGNTVNSINSFIGAGRSNTIQTFSYYSIIGGGLSNSINSSSDIYHNNIFNGDTNLIDDCNYSTVINGFSNSITGGSCTIIYGEACALTALYGTVIGTNLILDQDKQFVIGYPSSDETFSRTKTFWIYDLVLMDYQQEYKIEDSELKNQIHSSYIWDDTLVVRYKNSSGTVKTAQIALASTYMTPSIVSHNTAAGTGTSVVLTKPSSVTWNTSLIVAISVNGTQTITPSSGFTLINTGTRAGTTTRVYIKNVGTGYASEPSSYTFTLSGSVAYIGQILNCKNLKSSATPLDTSNNTNGSSTTATVASMSPVASSSGIYLWVGGIPSGGTTFSTPAGWTSYNVHNSISARQHIFYKTFTSGTTSGVANSTLSGSVEWATVGVCLTANLF